MANPASIREAIAAANDKFMAAFKAGDAAGLAALYTDDGQLLPPNSQTLTGKQAVQSFWQGAMDAGVKEAVLNIHEVEQHDDTAYEISSFTLHAADGTQLDEGKYIIVWKRVGGGWKIHRDIYNSSMPASAS